MSDELLLAEMRFNLNGYAKLLCQLPCLVKVFMVDAVRDPHERRSSLSTGDGANNERRTLVPDEFTNGQHKRLAFGRIICESRRVNSQMRNMRVHMERSHHALA